jgi:hypothetical protein
VLYDATAAVDVVPAAVPILCERVVHGVMEALVRYGLMQSEERARARRAAEQLAPRKFALTQFHSACKTNFMFSLA